MAPPSTAYCSQLKAQLLLLEQQLEQDQRVLSQLENRSPPNAGDISQWQDTVILKSEEVVAARTAWLTSGCLAPPPPAPPCYVVDNAFVSPLGYPDPNGLNLGDQVVGDNTGDGQSSDGWVERTLGVLTDADAPGASSSFLSKINDSGVAVGTRLDAKGAAHAYLWTANDKYVDVASMLDGTESWGADINNAGVVVGTVQLDAPFSYPGICRSFLYDPNGSPQIRYFEGFGGFPNSGAAALNNSGQVVGTCYDDQGIDFKPYLYSNGAMRDFSGKDNVFAFDINDSGIIIGGEDYVQSGAASSGAFIWSEGTSEPIAINGFAYAINNDDWVVGSAEHPNGQPFAFLYHNGAVFDLNAVTMTTAGVDLHLGAALDINDHGHIVAWGLSGDYSSGYDVLLVPCPPAKERPTGTRAGPGLSLAFGGGGAASAAGLKTPAQMRPFPRARKSRARAI